MSLGVYLKKIAHSCYFLCQVLNTKSL